MITMVIKSKAMLVARNLPASFPRNLVFEWARCDRLVEINPIIPVPKRIRYLHIDITCVLKTQSADGVIPPARSGNTCVRLLRMTTSRIGATRGVVQVTIVTNVLSDRYLRTRFARCCASCICNGAVAQRCYS